MAYNWEWKCKSGEITYDNHTYNLYEGNGFLICIDEWTNSETKEEEYQVVWFMLDKLHAKNCLGLTKGMDDMFEGKVEKIRIFKDHCRQWKDVVDLFTKSQPNITIEILPTERKEVA